MSAVSVGTAFLEIVPSARGFMGSLQRQVVGEAAGVGKAIGTDIAKGVEGAVTTGARGASGAVQRAGKDISAGISGAITEGGKDAGRSGQKIGKDVASAASKATEGTGKEISKNLTPSASSITAKGREIGGKLSAGVKARVGELAKSTMGPLLALGATAGAADFLKDAVSEARESQKVGAQTNAVIKSTGGAAKVTADQVGDLASAISNKTGIDDEAIQSGQNLLLTFTNIRNEAGKGNDVFDQSTQLLVDMAAAMGKEPKAAAVQLGKALNDPIKGMTALSKVGVSFTAQQKATNKALVDGGFDNALVAMGIISKTSDLNIQAKQQKKTIQQVAEAYEKQMTPAQKKYYDHLSEGGHTVEAQKTILAELTKEFGGSAAAQATAGEKLSTTWANFKETIGTALLPLIDKVETFLSEKAIPALAGFAQGLQDGTGPGGKVRDVVKQVADAVGVLVTWIKENPGLAKGLLAGFVGLVAAKKSVDGIGSAFRSVKGTIDTAKSGLSAFKQGLDFGTQIGTGGQFKTFGSAAKAAAGNVADLSKNAGRAALDLAKSGAAAVAAGAKYVIMKGASLAVAAAQKAWAAAQWLLNAAMNANPLGLIVLAVTAVIGAFVLAYKKIDWFRNFVDTAFRLIKGAIVAVFDWVKNNWPLILAILTGPVGLAVLAISKNWHTITGAFTAAKNWVVGAFKTAWNAVTKVLLAPIDAAKLLFAAAFGKNGIQKIFSGAVSAITSIWGGLKSALSSPINAVIGFINSPFISGLNAILSHIPGVSFRVPSIPTIGSSSSAGAGRQTGNGHQSGSNRGMATGGVLPGYTPGRDVHSFYSPSLGTLNLSGGEAIMRPEFTRAVGTGWIARANAAARGGGVAGVRSVMGFADGGIFGWIGDKLHGAWDFVKNAASVATQLITDPIGLAGKVVTGLLSGIGNSFAGQMVIGTGKKIAEGIGSAISNIFSSGSGAEPYGGSGSSAYPTSASGAAVNGGYPQRIPGLIALGHRLQSLGFSVGENPAFGGVHPVHMRGSYHYIGQAIDVNHGAGTSAAETSAINRIIPLVRAAGMAYVWQSKGHYDHLHIDTRRGSYVHDHWANYLNGGIPVFDNGGTLAAGLNLVRNNLGRPEPLIRADAPVARDGISATAIGEALGDALDERFRHAGPDDFVLLVQKAKARARRVGADL